MRLDPGGHAGTAGGPDAPGHAAVRKLSRDVGIPEKNEKIREEDLDQLAKDALADACYPGNPREATREQVIEMFRKLM